jgi:hypothetical protein
MDLDRYESDRSVVCVRVFVCVSLCVQLTHTHQTVIFKCIISDSISTVIIIIGVNYNS